MDCDIGCTIFCKVHLELNIYLFGNFFFGFERLECRFQFFISLLLSFSNRFEYNATILDSLKKITTMTSKKVHYSVLLPRLATFRRTKFMPRLRNKALPNTTMFKSNGIPIHGRLVL